MSSEKWSEHHQPTNQPPSHRCRRRRCVNHQGFGPFSIAKFAIDSDDSFPFLKYSILISLHLHIAFGISSYHSSQRALTRTRGIKAISNIHQTPHAAIYHHLFTTWKWLSTVDLLFILHNEMKYKLNHFMAQNEIILISIYYWCLNYFCWMLLQPKELENWMKNVRIFLEWNTRKEKHRHNDVEFMYAKSKEMVIAYASLCKCASHTLHAREWRKSVVIYWKQTNSSRKEFIGLSPETRQTFLYRFVVFLHVCLPITHLRSPPPFSASHFSLQLAMLESELLIFSFCKCWHHHMCWMYITFYFFSSGLNPTETGFESLQFPYRFLY